MTTQVDLPENTAVSRWLADLRMECYKKNLENFDTVKGLLEFKDLELKKIGVTNSKDRSTMLNSLASLKSRKEDTGVVLTRSYSTNDPTSNKSVSRRSSLRNFNFKGLLGSGGSRKSKKIRDSMSVTTPTLTSALDLHCTDGATSPPPAKFYPIPDYEELRDCNPSSGQHKAVPNEYVPSPPEIEQYRGRAYTVGICQQTPTEVPLRYPNEGFTRRDSMATYTTTSDEDERSTRSNSSSLHKSHHLSVVSMESGLSFGYDVDINPSLPLEVQPWFHSKLSREDAVALLNDEGDFLVRENTALPNTYTLSMYWRAQVDHTLIQCEDVVNSRNGTTVKYSFDGGAFDSIPELIYHHLKYQIPISRDTQNILMTPIHRLGTRLPFMPTGYHQPPPLERGERGHSTSTDHSSPSHSSISDDPASHHYHHNRYFVKCASSSDGVRPYLRPPRSSSMSPVAASVSSRQSPGREFAMRSSNSSGDLIEQSEETDRAVRPRNAISPPPTTGAPHMMRSRAMTDSRATHRGGVGSKRDSFGDYEVMESVSLLGSPPSQRKAQPGKAQPGKPSPAPAGNWGSGGDVKYAEIQHFRKPHEFTRRATFSGQQNSPSSSVKYAEVRFQRKQQPQPSISPHPFSTYDTVPSSAQARVNPYQSRAEVLAQKLQLESTPRTGSPTSHARLSRVESSPHSFPARYSTHSLPRQASSPLVMAGISEETTTTTCTTPTPQQPDLKMHSLPNRVRRRVQTQHETSRSGLATEGHSASKGGRVQTAAERVPKNLLGHDLLVTLHDTLGKSTEMELASHLTRADAVAFLLTPRPGEDKEVWKERVQKTTSSSGLYVGLQTLADTDGEKLWKRLYFRHLSLSQMVALCVVSAGETIERARMLCRFIELAFVLQSGAYGNLFSFISIMQGLTSPQVLNMTQTWQLFRSVFPEASHTHKQLQDILTSLSQGVAIYATDQISIPAIQHLRTAFHFEEPTLPGHAPSTEDHTLLGQHTNLLVGLDGIHTIIQHASRFSYNARKRLEALQYNVKLMDFFTQDFTRNYMHSIRVMSDDQMERRRRFDVLLSALVDRVEGAPQ